MCKEVDEVKFYCNMCGCCCKNLDEYSIILFPSDIAYMSEEFAISKEEFTVRYCVKKDIEYSDKHIVVYFMKINADKKCQFLKDDICTIYDIRPTQCRYTPYNFFAYYELWGYMPCVKSKLYPEGNSYERDMKLIEELRNGY